MICPDCCLVPIGVELCSDDNDVGVGCGVLTDDALTAIANQHILAGDQEYVRNSRTGKKEDFNVILSKPF
jgi:hypothetical protein